MAAPLICASIWISCDDQPSRKLKKVDQMIWEVKQNYAPDSRVAIFDVQATESDHSILLTGFSDQPTGLKSLVDSIASRGYRVSNQVRVLPDSTVGDQLFAVVNNSVGNMRSKPRHSAELATQVLMGTIVKVKRIEGEWYQVQSPDGYIAWIDHGGVELMTASDAVSWKNADKIIVTNLVTTAKKGIWTQAVVSDLVLGNKLKLLGKEEKYFEVEYPDGRKGFVHTRDAKRYFDWKSELESSPELVENFARKLLGTPYLWGGTSTKGMDCSGFTKTVYMMNGMVIPRDASQQVNSGNPVDEGNDFENLQKGDLVFFGKFATDSTRKKTTHVGIWLGNKEFIHSSQQVRISSFDQESDYYDEENLARYLEARRYLGTTVPFY